MRFELLPIILVLLAVLKYYWSHHKALERARYIGSYSFPPGLLEKVAKEHPELETKDLERVGAGLKQFFIAYLKSGKKYVSMPSQIVDELWHEFILYTRHYEQFCKQAFGNFLHHTPAVVLSTHHKNNTGIRRVWWYACLEEKMNPAKAIRLPLLFALDAELQIANGFQYAVDCKGLNARDGGSHCGGDMSSTGFDGTTDGFGDSGGGDGDGGDSGGCGGGCGGD